MYFDGARTERELPSQRIALTQTQANPTRVVESIRSMLVLYGSVRSTPLARHTDRSLLDLPLGQGTILSEHLSQAQDCVRRFGLDEIGMRVLVGSESVAPGSDAGSRVPGVRFVVERDPTEIRGVAGVLSDTTRTMDEDDYILVSSGAQVYMEPLKDLVHAMAKKAGDVVFVASRDGSPVGLWLLRVGVLRSVSRVGYVDLKEQALESWRHEYSVRVVERPRAYTLPVRSRTEYLDALRAFALGLGAGSTIDEDPYREEWESTFSIAEPGAQVGEDAVLHDSVALRGSQIGKGAVVVRSVLCPGAKVVPGARVTEQVVHGVVKRGRSR